ncbi:hypothetical protein N7486_010777 [Penicillium sp. IBT 16267x]|nr:hypothetical protein N7486_010777 [Penicillium sp. IBT 16267x]
MASVLWKAIQTPFISRNPEPREEAEDDDLGQTPLDGIIWGAICNSAALLYCAIHIAAWNFTFPTKAERIAWCVFSLTSLAMVCVFCITTNVGDYIRFLKSKNMLPSFVMALSHYKGQLSVIESVTQIVTLDVYIIARLGMVGLVFSSLRALPASSYTTIDWVTTIPHF